MQDVFVRGCYLCDLVCGKQISYMDRSTEMSVNQYPFLDHLCNLWMTKCHLSITWIKTGMLKSHMDTQVLMESHAWTHFHWEIPTSVGMTEDPEGWTMDIYLLLNTDLVNNILHKEGKLNLQMLFPTCNNNSHFLTVSTKTPSSNRWFINCHEFCQWLVTSHKSLLSMHP